MPWTEDNYDSEHYDFAQNILSIVFYVWTGVLLFLHCGIRPLPRGRSNESKNNLSEKKTSYKSESRNKIIAIKNILQRFTGLGSSLQQQSCSLWWTASNPALFRFFSWRRNLFAALRSWFDILLNCKEVLKLFNRGDHLPEAVLLHWLSGKCHWVCEGHRRRHQKAVQCQVFCDRNLLITFYIFCLRYNPYTQTVEVLNNSDKILDMAKELKGDLAIVASALRKVNKREAKTKTKTDNLWDFRKVQERDGDLDPSVVSTFLTAGLDISPYGSRLWL